MMTRREAAKGLLAGALASAPALASAQELKPIDLPAARTKGGMPLMSAFKLRHSTREYSDRPLTPQILSDLLWAAFGINRPSGDRTAPYWRHIMVIDVYAAMADGVWLYEPKAHSLLPYLKGDIRGLVQDNLNTHAKASLYEAFPPAEARRLAERFDCHYTPKHGSWLNPRLRGDKHGRIRVGRSGQPMPRPAHPRV
jgi:hypothetical protein